MARDIGLSNLEDTSVPAHERLRLSKEMLDQQEHHRNVWRARVHAARGMAWYQLDGDDRVSELKNAVESYDRAQELLCNPKYAAYRDKVTRNLAKIHLLLGQTYSRVSLSDGGECALEGIRHIRIALESWPKKEHAWTWAVAQHTLGTLYLRSPDGVRSKHIEDAITCFRDALKVRTPERGLAEWAATQRNLAVALMVNRATSWSTRIEEALSILNEVLDTALKSTSSRPESDVHPKSLGDGQLASIKSELGAAYLIRIRGEPAENVAKAIRHMRAALEFQKLLGDNRSQVRTMYNLSIAYSEHFHMSSHNAAKGVALLERARDLLDERDPYQVEIEIALANLLWHKGAIENRSGTHVGNADLNCAIQYAKNAMVKYKRNKESRKIALCHYLLGNAYCDLDPLDQYKIRSVDQGIRHYSTALADGGLDTFPLRRAQALNNLGTAYRDRARLETTDQKTDIEKAEECFQQSLETLRPSSNARETRRSARNLGDLYFENNLWANASEAYQKALAAVDNLYRASLSLAGREAELASSGDLYRRAAYAYAQQKEYKKAVAILEWSRARVLSESLARDRADLTKLRSTRHGLYSRYLEAAGDVRRFEQYGLVHQVLGLDTNSMEQYKDDLYVCENASNRLNQIVKEIRIEPGYERFLLPPDWQEISKATIPEKPLVYLFATTAGSWALIVRRPDAENSTCSVVPVPLPSLRENTLQERLDRWLDAYAHFIGLNRRTGALVLRETDHAKRDRKDWLRTIIETCDFLGMSLCPLIRKLANINVNSFIFIPCGLFSFLPLHAARWSASGEHKYIIDEMTVSYTPSAQALLHSRRIAEKTNPQRLLTISVNPDGKLEHIRNEVDDISRHFKKPIQLWDKEASLETVIQNIPAADIVHFACHGKTDWGHGDKSGLVMANSETLTVRRLFELQLKGARLATLSACETGIVGTAIPDEAISLPAALMRAGYAAVVASLWAVNDESTAALMRRFYERWQCSGLEQSPTEALLAAQRAIQSGDAGPKFSHPYFWAAFYIMGE